MGFRQPEDFNPKNKTEIRFFTRLKSVYVAISHPVKLVHTTISQLRPDSPSTLLIVFVIAFQNEKLNEIIKELVKEKRRRKIRLNGIIAELEAEKEKHKMEKDAMSNRMSKIEDMLKTMVRR
ncbi:hypothetical protein R6Q59_007548 [Mikania micrantha]